MARQVRLDIPAGTAPLYVEGKLIGATRTFEQDIVISIEDDGTGFPLVDPERLFDKF